MKIEHLFGYCEYEFESDYVHIFNLYVYPEFRRKGYAKMLIKQAIKEIRDKRYSGEIQIVARPTENSIDTDKLIKFYTEMGLTVFKKYL